MADCRQSVDDSVAMFRVAVGRVRSARTAQWGDRRRRRGCAALGAHNPERERSQAQRHQIMVASRTNTCPNRLQYQACGSSLTNACSVWSFGGRSLVISDGSAQIECVTGLSVPCMRVAKWDGCLIRYTLAPREGCARITTAPSTSADRQAKRVQRLCLAAPRLLLVGARASAPGILLFAREGCLLACVHCLSC